MRGHGGRESRSLLRTSSPQMSMSQRPQESARAQLPRASAFRAQGRRHVRADPSLPRFQHRRVVLSHLFRRSSSRALTTSCSTGISATLPQELQAMPPDLQQICTKQYARTAPVACAFCSRSRLRGQVARRYRQMSSTMPARLRRSVLRALVALRVVRRSSMATQTPSPVIPIPTALGMVFGRTSAALITSVVNLECGPGAPAGGP
mmetsp:Transcript_106799/g.228055  ORF Transcript_106799/g.228055 Transcript_106799/m.228055 type:complete len:206 (+) Transcript_106799:108-725(+)